MREIKFRAWDKENNCMVDLECVGENIIKVFGGEWENVESFKIMQYTGLRDINKKPIYEDFLLQWDEQKFCIKYDERYARYYLYEVKDGVIMNNRYMVSQDVIQTYRVKIIGNIYENPELLKEDEQE